MSVPGMTRGPWMATTENRGAIPVHFRPPVVTDATGERVIARLPDTETMATARAIAALPECLAALGCALANCATILRTNGYHEDPEAVEWCGVSLDRIQRAARAALSKARGEEGGNDGA